MSKINKVYDEVARPLRGFSSRSENGTYGIQFKLVSSDRVNMRGLHPSLSTGADHLDEWVKNNHGGWVHYNRDELDELIERLVALRDRMERS